MFRQAGAEALLLAAGAAPLRQMLGQAAPEAKVEYYLTRLRAPGALTAALNWYRATRPEDVAAAAITVPTLYVWGGEDAGVGPTAAANTEAWVSAPYRFEVLTGVSHWVPETAADRLSELLLEHLARHGG
jgi:pimeloyl-ACP methyl ester carboxylesterase